MNEFYNCRDQSPLSVASMEPAAHFIFLILLAVAALCFWLGARADRLFTASGSWPVVDAHIVASSIANDSRGQRWPDIAYTYDFGGAVRQSKRLAIVTPTRTLAACEAIVARYPVGSLAQAWVNPERPDYAILEREPGGGRLLRQVGSFLALLTILVWLALAYNLGVS